MQEVFLCLLEQLETRLHTPAHLALVKRLQRRSDCLIQGCQVMECHVLDVGIYRTVHQLHGILHQCLVLRVTCPGREHCHVIELGHAGKIIVDDGLVAVTLCDCGFQIVRDDCHGRASEEVEGVLAGGNQVLLLL